MGYFLQVLVNFSPEGISDYPLVVGRYGGFLINTFGIAVGFYKSYLA
jgi:hypothetical protein